METLFTAALVIGVIVSLVILGCVFYHVWLDKEW